MLDAPVSGGEIGAISATLSVMVGGDVEVFETVKPILDAMGNPERVVRIGESGAGQVCKLCNQMVLGGTIAAVGEAFSLARKAGVDAARVRDALLGGFAASRVLEVHGERMLKKNCRHGACREQCSRAGQRGGAAAREFADGRRPRSERLRGARRGLVRTRRPEIGRLLPCNQSVLRAAAGYRDQDPAYIPGPSPEP
jgi:hypothetical protein